MKNSLLAICLNLSIFPVLVDGQNTIYIDEDKITINDRGFALTEQHTACGNAVFVITTSLCKGAETPFPV